MGHIEKHLNKTPEELVMRLLKDWKLFSGCLYTDVMELVYQKLQETKFDYKEQSVITLKFDRIIGYGYNRKFEKLLSDTVKIVVIGNNNSLSRLRKLYSNRRVFFF